MQTNHLLIWFTILLSGIFVLALLKIKTRTFSKRTLIFFVLNFAFHFISIYLSEYSKEVTLHNFNAFFSSNYGPLLLIYVKSLKATTSEFKRNYLWFFVPSIFFLIVGLFDFSSFTEIMTITSSVLLFSFIFLGLSIITYKQNIELFESPEKKWIFYILLIFSVLLSLAVAHLVFAVSYLDDFHNYSTTLIFVLSVFLICFLIFYSITTPELFQALKKKYKTSNLSSNQSLLLSNKISKYLEEDEKFLDSDVTLLSISEELQTTPKKVSQAINEHLGNNFYDVINSCRLKKAETMLKNNPDIAIKNIMYDCGFNNKATFNKVFKQKNQTTPSEYRAKYKLS